MEHINRKIRLWEYENLRHLRKLRREFYEISMLMISSCCRQLNLFSYLVYASLRSVFVLTKSSLRAFCIFLGRSELRIQISPEKSVDLSEYYHSNHTAETLNTLLKR